MHKHCLHPVVVSNEIESWFIIINGLLLPNKQNESGAIIINVHLLLNKRNESSSSLSMIIFYQTNKTFSLQLHMPDLPHYASKHTLCLIEIYNLNLVLKQYKSKWFCYFNYSGYSVLVCVVTHLFSLDCFCILLLFSI